MFTDDMYDVLTRVFFNLYVALYCIYFHIDVMYGNTDSCNLCVFFFYPTSGIPLLLKVKFKRNSEDEWMDV